MDRNKIVSNIWFTMIPLILYGFYKNGVIVWMAGKINLLGMLKPIILPLSGYFLALGIEAFFTRKNDIKWKEHIFGSLKPIYALWVGMALPSTTNIFIYLGLVLIFLLLFHICKTKRCNQPAIILLTLAIVLIVTKQFHFENTLELSKKYGYDLVDLLFGKNVGGICATNSALALAGLFYLATTKYYKSDIPLYILASYGILSIIFGFFGHNIVLQLTNMLSYSIIFTSIFIAADTQSTPYTKRGRLVYGLLVGISSFFLGMLIHPWIALLICILLYSALSRIIDEMILQF